MINKISIIGGDYRFVKLAGMLIEEGVEVLTYALDCSEEEFYNEIQDCNSIDEAIGKSNIILGPIPLSSNGISINAPFSDKKIECDTLIEKLKNKIFIAGNINDEIIEKASLNNVKVIDILKREELAVLNAISTAEGTLKIAIEETTTNVHGSNVLILGFGRIAKVLANMMNGIGANVSCAARRNEPLAWVRAYGYNPIKLENINEELKKFDIIVNTIPHIILDDSNLDLVKSGTLIIDLASNPGGVDREVVKEKNIKFIWALSIPGKIAPVTSAEFIKETLYNIYNELNIT